MPVSPREVPIYWWAVACGVDLQLLAVLKAEHAELFGRMRV
jgi:hypothetical protein